MNLPLADGEIFLQIAPTIDGWKVTMIAGNYNRVALIRILLVGCIAVVCTSCSESTGPGEHIVPETGLHAVRDTLFIDEGEASTISALFNCSNTDGLTISWNSGDGRSRTEPLRNDSLSITYTYENNGIYLVVILAERNGVVVGADTTVVVVRQRLNPVPAGKVVITISETILHYSDTIKTPNQPIVYKFREESELSFFAYAGDAFRPSNKTFKWNNNLEARISNKGSDAQGGHLRSGMIRLSKDGTAIEALSLYSKDSLGWIFFEKRPSTLREARITLADIPIQSGTSAESGNAVYTGYFNGSTSTIRSLAEYYYTHGTKPMASILTGFSTGYRVTVAFSK